MHSSERFWYIPSTCRYWSFKL